MKIIDFKERKILRDLSICFAKYPLDIDFTLSDIEEKLRQGKSIEPIWKEADEH